MLATEKLTAGTKSSITVGDVAHKEILFCVRDTPLYEAAILMRSKKCSSIIVADADNVPVGIWTEADALRIAFEDPAIINRPVSDFMSTPIRSLAHDTPIDVAGSRFRSESFRHFLVTGEDGSPFGIVTLTDVILSQGIEHYLFMKTVSSILKNPLLRVSENTPITTAALEMRSNRCDAAAVVNAGGETVGIVTERDIVHAIAGRSIDRMAGDIASRPVLSIAMEATLFQARSRLEECGIRHLGILDRDEKIVGILSFNDILTSVEQQYVEQLRDMLRDRDSALRDSTQNLRLAHQVIEASLDGIIVTDAHNHIEYVNTAFTRLTGYQPEEAISRTPAFLQSGKHGKKFYKEMWETLAGTGAWQGEIWNRRKNGEIYPEWMTITAILDDHGNAKQYAAIFSDITDRKKSEEQIQNLAYYDVLTGLPNRRLFNDRLEIALKNATRYDLSPALLFLDLDMFKRINDTLGHSVGDEVLKQVSGRLLSCLRDSDSVSRLGGDEFTILLNETESVESVAKLAQRIITEVSKPLRVEENEFYLTASVGVAVFPHDGQDGETLIRNADTAMYKAKEQGRNNFQLYTKTMNEEFYSKLSLENHLRRAMSHEQFHMVYQPKTDIRTGRICSLEALARWEDTDLGHIPPSRFIPTAETMGIITQLSELFFKQVFIQWRQWVSAGLPRIPVAINLSMHHFRQDNLARKLIALANQYGMEPDYLEIEITESTFMDQLDKVVHELERLGEFGVKVAIDDFGTGYSSFSYLKRIPVDTLKIDRSFIQDLTGNDNGCAIVSAIIAMAHQMGIRVVAEGVETEEQRRLLLQKGCDEIQGYLIARPMLPGQIAKFVKQSLAEDLSHLKLVAD